jgi:hypothetical protein
MSAGDTTPPKDTDPWVICPSDAIRPGTARAFSLARVGEGGASQPFPIVTGEGTDALLGAVQDTCVPNWILCVVPADKPILLSGDDRAGRSSRPTRYGQRPTGASLDALLLLRANSE